MKKLFGRATSLSIVAAGVVTIFILVVAYVSLRVIEKLYERELLEQLELASQKSTRIFMARLAAAMGDLALFSNLAGEPGTSSREAIKRGMRSLQNLRPAYTGAALFDREGRELYSTGAVPRALSPAEGGNPAWFSAAKNLDPQEILLFPEKLAAAPVLVFAVKVGRGDSGDLAVIVATAQKLMADAREAMDKDALVLYSDDGTPWELGSSGQFPPGFAFPSPEPSGGQDGGRIQTRDVLGAWRALPVADPSGSAPAGLRLSGGSRLGWRLAALRSAESLREDMAGIATGVWLLAFVLALLAAPLTVAGSLAYFRLAEVRQKLNEVLNSAPGGILEVEPDEKTGGFRLEIVNPAARAILAGPGVPEGKPPRLPARLESLIRQSIGTRRPVTAEIQLADAPGRWGSVRVAPTQTGAVVALTDITERMNQEAALRESRHSLELAARMAKIGAWRVNLEPPAIWWSEEVRRIHAVPDDYQPDLASAFEFYPPASRGQLRAMFERCVETGEEFDGEFDFRDARGRLAWVRVLGQAERDPASGKVIRVHGTFQDITETHESAAALTESRELLSVAFWGASLSVSDCRFDTGEFVFDTNLLRLLGCDKREVLPTLKFRDSLMPEEDRARWAAALEAAAAGRAPFFECEYRLAAKGGGFRWVLERSKIVSVDTENRPVRMVGILTDITRLKEAEALVAAALEYEKDLARKAQAAGEAKKQFLAMMSHEIRTPLNSVLGYAEMLAARPLDPEASEYVATIRESGASLLRILNDILDYSRIESGKLEIESRAYSPRAVVESATGMLLPQARGKGIELNTKVADNVPPKVMGDEMRVRQVLLNLAGNAVKFTAKGRVDVRVSVRDNGGELVFSISDTGPGIEAAKLESIFEPFMQADASISRAHGGTGLGLAISSRLVHLMGGTIWAESKLGRGSEFSFSLPLCEVPEDASVEDSPPQTPAEASYAAKHPLKILIVEDDHVNARLTKLILTRLGYTPAVAQDGDAAVKAVAAGRPDLILMDLRMPKMDGLEATRKIRWLESAQSWPGRIYIAALTADVLPEGRQESLEAGMDDYVTKPVSAQKILELVRKAWAAKNGNPHPEPV